jgi:hypothetical protein
VPHGVANPPRIDDIDGKDVVAGMPGASNQTKNRVRIAVSFALVARYSGRVFGWRGLFLTVPDLLGCLELAAAMGASMGGTARSITLVSRARQGGPHERAARGRLVADRGGVHEPVSILGEGGQLLSDVLAAVGRGNRHGCRLVPPGSLSLSSYMPAGGRGPGRRPPMLPVRCSA